MKKESVLYKNRKARENRYIVERNLTRMKVSLARAAAEMGIPTQLRWQWFPPLFLKVR
jgi:hypothetical protein